MHSAGVVVLWKISIVKREILRVKSELRFLRGSGQWEAWSRERQWPVGDFESED